MKTTVANITSYIGISADAEHYYCRYRELSQTELCEYIHGTYERLYGATINGTDLLRKVTEEEAEQLAASPCEVLDMVEYGTIRFVSVHQITEELRRQFPESNLIITMHESVKEYVSSMLHEEFYRLFDSLTREQQEKILHHFGGHDFDRYNDRYKRQELLCHIFRHQQEEEFVEEIRHLQEAQS